MTKLVLAMISMSGVTYLIRFLPFAIFKKNINSRFIQSFLYYVPFSVLAAMTFPAIFYSTGDKLSAIVGTVVAVGLAIMEKGLLTIAVAGVVGAYITMLISSLL